MSSHHIIRDEQEPALLIADPEADYGLVQQLLEWSPVVVVIAECLPRVLNWGIKIDKLVCQPDRQAEYKVLIDHQMPVEIWTTTEYAPLAGVKHLLGLQQKAINVLLPIGPAYFAQLRSQWTELAGQIPLVFYGNNWKGYLITDSFKKWVAAGTRFAIEQPAEAPSLNHQDGLVWAKEQAGMVDIRTKVPIFILEH